ncbi:MAG: hypothetical protein DRR16_21270 [Candidatus Parabeggiatoa sp. nov. 3]
MQKRLEARCLAKLNFSLNAWAPFKVVDSLFVKVEFENSLNLIDAMKMFAENQFESPSNCQLP